MRKLTIKREKSFVGSLTKMKVYIEDASSSEISLNNVSYRKIGDLKNGEEKTFIIDDNKCNLLIIGDKASKDICNEIYNIKAGEEDIYLTGKNIFNPAAGNAFRFNGVADSQVLTNRKNANKKGIIFLSIFVVIGLICGVLLGKTLSQSAFNQQKKFSEEGMTITLTNKFRKASIDGYTVCYDSKDVAVFAIKEKFSSAKDFEKYTLSEYGNLLISSNNLNSSVKVRNNNGLTYFEYQNTNPETNEPYHFFTTVYKTSDSFWMIQFVTLEKNYNDYKQNFVDWAKNVEF